MPRTLDPPIGAILRHNVERRLCEMDMSPAEFCYMAQISRNKYSQFFKSPHGPRVGTVKLFAAALGVPIYKLLLPINFGSKENP